MAHISRLRSRSASYSESSRSMSLHFALGWPAARTRALRRARAGAPSGSSGTARFPGNRTAALSALRHHKSVGGTALAVKSAASHGVVAQLGERRVRNAKVGSSILLHSTTYPQVGD